MKILPTSKREFKELTEELERREEAKKWNDAIEWQKKLKEAIEQLKLDCGQIMNAPKIKIQVFNHQIKSAMPGMPISGTVLFTPPCGFPIIRTSCFLACGHWHNLNEVRDETINIVDHLDKLLPECQGTPTIGPKGPIGLITFQNGMINDVEDFKKISGAVVGKFSEAPPLYRLTQSYNRVSSYRYVEIFRRMEKQ